MHTVYPFLTFKSIDNSDFCASLHESQSGLSIVNILFVYSWLNRWLSQGGSLCECKRVWQFCFCRKASFSTRFYTVYDGSLLMKTIAHCWVQSKSHSPHRFQLKLTPERKMSNLLCTCGVLDIFL